MKLSDIRTKSAADLKKELNKAQEKIAKQNLQLNTGEVTNRKDLNAAKKDVARILTVMKEQELGIVIKPKKQEKKNA